MRVRTLGAIALLPILAFATSGCMQFGEYAMGAECEGLSEDVVSAVQEMSGTEPEVRDMWAGEAEYWCEFTVEVESARDVGDANRASIERAVEALVEEAGSDIRVTLLYGNGMDVVAS